MMIRSGRSASEERVLVSARSAWNCAVDRSVSMTGEERFKGVSAEGQCYIKDLKYMSLKIHSDWIAI